jgi:hypothetical protein
MAIYSTLKKYTAYLMGETDYATSTGNEIRNESINMARSELYNEYPFIWTRSAETLTLSSGVSDLNSAYNPIFGLERVEDSDGNKYKRIHPSEQSNYDGDTDYYYWIDYNTSTSKYRFNTGSSATTIYVVYHILPTDLSDDGDKDLCPDPMAIAYLSAAKTWLATEVDETNHDRMMAKYQERKQKLISQDKKYEDRKRVKLMTEEYNLGYNTR